MSDPHSAPEGKPAPAGAPPHDAAYCLNCGAKLMGPYCYRCGQATRHALKHLPALAADAADAVLNIDGRIMRTLPALFFRPGFLANEYFSGRRVRYIPPFRLMFFMSVLVFLLIRIVVVLDQPLAGLPTQAGATTAQPAPAASVHPPAAASVATPAQTTVNLDMLHARWLPAPVNRFIDEARQRAKANVNEIAHGSPDSRREALRRVSRNMLAAAPQTLFVLMPIMALLLKLMYVFKSRLYIEHLIVVLYSHAFIFLTLLLSVLVALLADRLPGGRAAWSLLQGALWTWVAVYLLVMQKRVYRQGWFLTALKYGVTGMCYMILLLFALVATALIGVSS